MVRFARVFTTLVFVSAIVVVSAFAESSAIPGQADIVRTPGCIFFDANGAPFNDAAAEFQIVYTNNKNGNYTANCHGQLPAGAVLPDGPMFFDFNNTGFTCGVGDDWKGSTSPSGEARFTCHGRLN